MRQCAMALIAAASLAQAEGADSSAPQASYGATDPEQVSCPVLMRMDERAPRGTELQFYTWLHGYVAGRVSAQPGGVLRPLPATGPERERHYATLLGYCREHPEGTFGAAVQKLLESLGSVTAP
jgi:hypothetical protein